MLYMAPLPPPFPKALPSFLASGRQWGWATWKLKWEIKNLREVRDVTTTGEAGEKKENIIRECRACSSCMPKANPWGDGCAWMAALWLTARRQGDWEWDDSNERRDEEAVGVGEGVKKEDARKLPSNFWMQWRQSMTIITRGELLYPKTFLCSKKEKPL